MFQIDEKVLADNRTLITVQSRKDQINPLTKNGTLNFTLENNDVWLTTPKIKQAYVKRADFSEQYDKVVLARNGTNVDGNLSFDGDISFNENLEVKKDLIVKGNFIVEGDSTVIDTPRLSIEDNIIEINRNEIGNGITLKKSGMAINRGIKSFARNLYDETNKAFVFDTSEEMDSDVNNDNWLAMIYTEQNGIYEPGEFRAKHRVTSPFMKVTDSLTVSNISTLNKLNVIGPSNFQGDLTATNLITNGTLTAKGLTTLEDMLTVNAVSNFNDNVNIKNALTVTGVSTFNSRTTHNKGITVLDGATITGNSIFNNQLEVKQNVSFGADAAITGTTSTNNINVSEATSTNTLNVTTDATIGNNLTTAKKITSTSLEANDVEVNTNLWVKSTSFFEGPVTLENGGSLSIMGGNLFVTGESIFNGSITATDANFSEAVRMDSSLDILGKLIAKDILTQSNISILGSDNLGVRFWDSDNHKIYVSKTTGSNAGRLDSTSDMNMYFKISEGTNRGFVFRNGSSNVMQIESDGQVRTLGKVIIKGSEALTKADMGTGNNLDADKLDGFHATDFLRRNVPTDTTEYVSFLTDGKAIKFSSGAEIFKAGPVTIKTDNGIDNGFKVLNESGIELFRIKDHQTDGISYKGSKVWHSLNDGANSGLDADLLDGKHASEFSSSSHLHDDRYIKNNEVDLKDKYRIVYNEEFDSLDFMYIG